MMSRYSSRLGTHTIQDLQRAGQSCLFTTELDRHRIIGTSTFDRVFYVPIITRAFKIDNNVGNRYERIRAKPDARGSQSVQSFNIAGFICDIRVT